VFLFALLYRISQSELRRSPIDISVLSLLVIALLATYIYSASFGAAINNLRALLRYLAVFYLAFHLGFSLRAWKRFSGLFALVIVLNIFLSMAQFGLGDSYPDKLKVGEKMRVSVGENVEVRQIDKQEKIGAVQGLQEAPGVFGALMVVAVSILLTRLYLPSTRSRRFIKWLIVFSLVSAFLTYSKSGFLLAVMTAVIFYYHFNAKLRRLILVSSFIGLVLGVITFVVVSSSVQQSFAMKGEVSATENLLNLFSAQYWKHFFAAERGWVIKEVGSQILISLPVVGYSPDPETARKLIAESSGGGLAKLVGYVAFEDVYWVALLGYFGIFGMLVLFSIFYLLYRAASRLQQFARFRGDKELLAFVSGFMALLFILIPYCFFERVLEIQVFSYYFWLMAGMIAGMHRALLVYNNRQNQSTL